MNQSERIVMLQDLSNFIFNMAQVDVYSLKQTREIKKSAKSSVMNLQVSSIYIFSLCTRPYL